MGLYILDLIDYIDHRNSENTRFTCYQVGEILYSGFDRLDLS